MTLLLVLIMREKGVCCKCKRVFVISKNISFLVNFLMLGLKLDFCP